MNEKLFTGILVLLVLLGGYTAYKVSQEPVVSSRPLGAVGTNTSTITYSSVLNWFPLYDLLTSIRTDLVSVRAPLAGALTFSSSSAVVPTMATSGVAIIRQTITGATPGDFVIASVNATATDLMRLTVNANVSAADTVSVLFTSNPTSTFGWVGGTIPLRIVVIPSSTFAGPAALLTVTTTTPQN